MTGDEADSGERDGAPQNMLLHKITAITLLLSWECTELASTIELAEAIGLVLVGNLGSTTQTERGPNHCAAAGISSLLTLPAADPLPYFSHRHC